ncbi:CENP-S associating centromere protein X-domain-containing protein, partial [Lasiosphaeria miniovina]
EDQEEDVEEEDGQDDEDDDEEEDKPATVPPELLTRLLHEFFTADGTRITKDANSAVAKYMDVFVREAIARSAVERASGFLEVEDLEKVAPQLLLDL